LTSNEQHFHIVNYGGVAAEIVDSDCAICSTRSGNVPVEYRAETILIEVPSKPLEAGTSRLFITKITLSDWDRENITQGAVYVRGLIRYKGESTDAIYATGFCRRWNLERRRFMRFELPEHEAYEYED
jgi:hypothetical protein